MKAVTWQAINKVSVENVEDPHIKEPTDAIIKITSTAICGSDLHLYEVMAPFMERGDIMGHEPMGIVQEVGTQVTNLTPGDRVVIPFNISCGHCNMCQRGFQSQCETTQVRSQNRGAALFGYTKLYGHIPGGQAEYLRVPQAQYTHVKVPQQFEDDRFLYLSDVLPTAWQAVEYAQIPPDGIVVVLGLGPIGDMTTRIALYKGAKKVIGVDLVEERLSRAKQNGIEVVNWKDRDVTSIIREMTDGRGPDSVIDAVGMEAHGSPSAQMVQTMANVLPDAAAQKLFTTAGVDRLNALHNAIDMVARGGTISIAGVYAGQADPIAMDTLFDKQVTIKMGQANVKNWTDDILALLEKENMFGVDEFATHHMPLDEAPHAYDIFQKKKDGAIKIVLKP